MKDVNYRQYEPKDISHLVELGIKLHEELTQKKIELPNSYRETTAMFFKSALVQKNYLCVIAEVDGQIVSTGGICIYHTPPLPSDLEAKVGFLTHFYTLSEFRRNGFAQNVLNLLINKARELKLIRLHMGTTEMGFGLYTKAGFKEPRFKQLMLHLNS